MEKPIQAAVYTGNGEQLDAKSMHLAVCAGEGWQELNFGIGVLFAEADFLDGSLAGTTKLMESPFLFRSTDGRMRVAAVTTTVGGRRDNGYAMWGTDDLVHFQFLGREDKLPIATDRLGITVEGIPVEASILPLTETEADYLIRKFGDVHNIAVDPVEVRVPLGKSLTQLPGVKAYYSDGSQEEIPVAWNGDELKAIAYEQPGTYIVTGQAVVKDYPVPMIPAIADPMIRIYNGYYYLIATDETPGNKNLYIRRADSIEALQNAEPRLVFQGTDSGDYSGCNWAPELHIIGGRLYCLFASSTTGEWDGVQSRIMCCKGDPERLEDWEAPVRIEKKDGSPLIEMGITLDMTYFEAAGGSYYCWANRVIDQRGADTSDLFIAGVDPQNPQRLLSDPVCLLKPKYAWDRQHTTVDEGPYILKHDGKLFLSFSGDSVSDYYCLSWLVAAENSDLLDPLSWSETGYPVLGREHVERERGPGHNSFTKDEYGRDVLVYHSKPDGGERSFCARTIHYGFDGTPLLYLTADKFLKPEFRVVKATVIVGEEINFQK